MWFKRHLFTYMTFSPDFMTFIRRTSHKSNSWFMSHLSSPLIYCSYRPLLDSPLAALVWECEVHDGWVGGWRALPAIWWLFICRCVYCRIYECSVWLLMLLPYIDEIMEMPEWIVFPKLIVIESPWCQVQIWGQASRSQVVHWLYEFAVIPGCCFVNRCVPQTAAPLGGKGLVINITVDVDG